MIEEEDECAEEDEDEGGDDYGPETTSHQVHYGVNNNI